MEDRGAVLLFASTCAAALEQLDHNLLSTTLLARDTGKLPDAMRTLKRLNEPGAVNALFVKVQHQISRFIIHHVEAYPSISLSEGGSSWFALRLNDTRGRLAAFSCGIAASCVSN